MKKSILSLLLLTATLTTQIQSHFVRGAIYEKDGQFIVLLEDIHVKNIAQQREELIEKIKSYDQQTILTLVEDPEREEVYKEMPELFSYRKIADISPSPLWGLYSDLKKENVNVVDVECRYMALSFNVILPKIVYQSDALPEEYWIERSQKEIAEERISEQESLKKLDRQVENIKMYVASLEKHKKLVYLASYLLSKNFLTKAHFENEIRENIEQLIRYIKEAPFIAPENTEQILDYFYLILKTLIRIYERCIDISLKRPAQFLAVTDNFASGDTREALDANIVYNILKNKDKKIIVVCAGAGHTKNVKKILENIMGYDLKKSFYGNFGINITELFEDLNQMKPQSNMQIALCRQNPLEIILTQEVENMIRNSIEQTCGPLDGTSQIIKNQIRHNYNVMFPRGPKNFASRRTQKQPLAIEWHEAQ